MTRFAFAAVAATLLLVLPAVPLAAQESGYWQAASKTATSITGDIVFGNEKLTINFASYPLAEIRRLTFAEMGAVFQDDLNPNAAGNLFRVSIPGEKKFLHKNTLCGSEEVKWIVTSVSGKVLQLAMFSGDKPPVFTADAIGNSTDLCGTYNYGR